MEQEFFEHNIPSDKIIKPEEVEQIVKAVLNGKYSWACVLFLHFIGYNPLKYIPYRTYIRLLKNNCLMGKKSFNTTENNHMELVEIKSKWTHLERRRNNSN